MGKSTEMDVKVKFGLKSFITVVAILLAVLIFVGVLTFVIPAGEYARIVKVEHRTGIGSHLIESAGQGRHST